MRAIPERTPGSPRSPQPVGCRQQIACGRLQSDLWLCQAQVEKDGKLSSAFICSVLFLLGQARLKIILRLHAQGFMSGGEGEGRKKDV